MAYDGLRINGDESTPDGKAHRHRYYWASTMIPSGSRVLDYGCGTGYGTRIMRAAGLDVVGYDPDPSMGAATEIPAGPFDAVVCFEVLEHMDVPPLGTLIALEKRAPIVIASVPYLEARGVNKHHKWFRLQEATFPGRYIAYQYEDGTISPMAGSAQNLIVCSF